MHVQNVRSIATPISSSNHDLQFTPVGRRVSLSELRLSVKNQTLASNRNTQSLGLALTPGESLTRRIGHVNNTRCRPPAPASIGIDRRTVFKWPIPDPVSARR